jgi:hypothetical protein
MLCITAKLAAEGRDGSIPAVTAPQYCRPVLPTQQTLGASSARVPERPHGTAKTFVGWSRTTDLLIHITCCAGFVFCALQRSPDYVRDWLRSLSPDCSIW